jgi:hypothetical protein
MDHKTLKSDLTYALKKLTKEGKTITFEVLADNLQYEDGQLILVGDKVDVLEALIFVKGFKCPPIEKGFSVPLTDIISEQGQITKTDLYDFMDGLEFVEGNDKSKFYEVGAYIREKFTPVGCRTEKLMKPVFKEERHFKVERRFIVHTRPLPGEKRGGGPSVVEVECEIIHSPLMKDGEFAARVLKPEWLWEPVRKLMPDGTLGEVIEPPVYCSHAVYWNVNQAMVAAEHMVRGGFEFEIRKGKRESYTDEELKAKYAEIREIRL